jgi:hypothetical protein
MQAFKLGYTVALTALMASLMNSVALAQTPVISVRITKLIGEDVLIDKGSSAGVEPKMIFDIYSDALVVRLPFSGEKEPVYVKQEIIARLIIRSASSNEARAAVYGKSKKTIKVGFFGLYNPTQKAENQAPFVASVSPEKDSEYLWRDRVQIKLTIINEPEDQMYFEWTCRRLTNDKAPEGAFEGGVLLSERTIKPENTWVAPPQPGRYRIQVNIYDTAGKKVKETLDLKSLGISPTKKLGANLKYKGVFCDSNMFQNIRDVTFDKNHNMYVLQTGSSSIVGGTSPSILVIDSSGQVKEKIDLPSKYKYFARLCLNSRYLFLLDSENKAVKRFRLARNGNIAQTLSSNPISFGRAGVGNGKFTTPVDMCLDSNGHVAVLDGAQSAIQVFRENGVFLFSMGMEGRELGQMQRAVALASDQNGRLFCLDDGRKRVLVFKNGAFDRELDCTSRGRLTGLAYDPYKEILGIADMDRGIVQRLSLKTGKVTPINAPWNGEEPSTVRLQKLRESAMLRCDGTSRFIAVDREGSSLALFNASTSLNNSGFKGRMGGVNIGDSLKVAASPSGDLVILNTSTMLLTRVTRRGWINLRLGGGDSKSFQFKTPIDVAVGDSGRIYVLDAKLSQVFHFNSNGFPARTRLGTPGPGPSQLNSCLDMDCSGDRKYLTILQERKDHNMHQMQFSGAGQAWPRIATISDPVVGCQGKDGKFWIIDDDVLVNIPPGGAASPTSYEFDSITDMSTGVDGFFYAVDIDDAYISVHRAGGPQAGKIQMKKISKPKDIGMDNYGRMYVYDDSTEKVHLLSD